MPWPCNFEYMLSGVDITVCHIATEWTDMGSYRQTLLYDLPTVVTLLACETRVHSYNLMPSTCSLCAENIEKRAPAGVHDGFSEMVIFDHMTDSQVFYHNALIAFGIGLGCLEMVISPLSIDLEMSLCYVLSRLPSSLTVFLAPAQLTLLASQGLLRATIEARVLNRMALAIRKERLESYINPNISMCAYTGKMLVLWLSLADNQGIPMSIRTQDQMDRFRRPLNGPMQLDLEAMPDLLGHNEVFLVLMQVHIFAVLAQLDGMPAVRLLETGEAYSRDAMLLGCKKALERRTQTISQHLNGGGRNMCALSLESRFQVILAGEGAFSLILSLDGRKHLVIDTARLFQALHEHMGLWLIHEQAILKCSHADIQLQPMRNVKWIVPPAGGRQCTHLAKASGPLAA